MAFVHSENGGARVTGSADTLAAAAPVALTAAQRRRLADARVLVVGAGGLGSPAAMYLAAAGVGHLGIVDRDLIDVSNLQRQILHTDARIGSPKTRSAAATLTARHPHLDVTQHDVTVNAATIADLIAGYDVVVDGVDNFAARFVVNDACYFARTPLVEAGILRFYGQLMTILPDAGPCYRCIHPEPPPPGAIPSCQEAGVLGAMAGVIGTLQAGEAVKLLLDQGDTLVGHVLVFEALPMVFRRVPVRRNPHCPLCGPNATIATLDDYALTCDRPAPRSSQT